MNRIIALLAVIISALAIFPAVSSAAYLGSPYTNRDGTFEAAKYWYPKDNPVELEYRKVQTSPEKWRFTELVRQNEIVACSGPYYWTSETGRTYLVPCFWQPRRFDSWCWSGTHPRGLGYGEWIRVRDLSNNAERVSNVSCVKWY